MLNIYNKIKAGEKVSIVVKTLSGMEDLLSEELKTLGATNVESLSRALRCDADLKTIYRIILSSRLAMRVMVPLFSYNADSTDWLYKKAMRLPWTKVFDRDQTFAIDSVIHSHHYEHTKFTMLRFKDALVDKFSESGSRPDVDSDEPEVLLHLLITGDNVEVLLDLTGFSLHRRGYRESGGLAPLNEVLAAGMLMHAGWDGTENLVDPMCGSGTILLEAHLMSMNMGPGLLHHNYVIRNYPFFDEDLWAEVRKQELAKMVPPRAGLFGYDSSDKAVSIARRNLKSLRDTQDIQIKQADFFSLNAPVKSGTMILNPPYGERMKEDDILDFYKKIGDAFKQNWAGFEAWILSANVSALKTVGLRTKRKLHLYNGPLECRYHGYDLFKGRAGDQTGS